MSGSNVPSNRLAPFNQKVERLVSDARKMNFWLYDPVAKYWYTPDEFEIRFKDRWDFSQTEQWFKGIEIRDPMEGLRAGFKKLDEMRKKLEMFSAKALIYYKK